MPKQLDLFKFSHIYIYIYIYIYTSTKLIIIGNAPSKESNPKESYKFGHTAIFSI